MLRRAALLAGFLAILGNAHALSRGEGLERAQGHLEAGNPARAIELYRELQVDHPQDPAVLFGLGCAQYRRAEQHVQAEQPEEAAKMFEAARGVFDRVLSAEDARVAADGAFNRANCVARIAELTPAGEKYDEAVAALRKAESAYEAVLREHPDDARAGQNLDHVRYALKQLLRNPPEEQEKEDDQQDDQQNAASVFEYAETDIEGADAKTEAETVELVMPEKNQL